MSSSVFRTVVLGALLLGAGAPLARADLNRASEHFEKGTRLYQVGEYAKALEEFKAGYLEDADPSFLFNTAQCYWRLGQEQEALLGYKRFLSLAPDTPLRPDVERKMQDLQHSLNQRAAAAAAPAERSPTTLTPRPVPQSRQPSPLHLRARTDELPETSRWPAWLAGATTLGLAGAAAVVGVQANSQFETLRNTCGVTASGCSDEEVQHIQNRARLVNVLWGLAGASAIVTGIAIYATSDGDRAVSVAFKF